MFHSIWIVYNEQAGWYRQKQVRRLVALLQARQPALRLCRTDYAGHAGAWAAEACRQGVELLVVAGGDGTLNEAVNGLAGEPPATWPLLAAYPSGTINLVARELGVPLDPDAFTEMLWQRRVRQVWPGQVNGRYFLANVGAGFDGWVVHRVSKPLKRWLSRWAYAWQLLLLLLAVPWRRRYHVTADGQDRGEASAVIIAKGRYYAGPHHAVYAARLDRPELQVCLFTRRRPWEIAGYIWWLAHDRLPLHPAVRTFAAREVSVSGGGGRDRQIDGDTGPEGPLRVTVAAAPLYMLGNH